VKQGKELWIHGTAAERVLNGGAKTLFCGISGSGEKTFEDNL
jgi:hypothetical protein